MTFYIFVDFTLPVGYNTVVALRRGADTSCRISRFPAECPHTGGVIMKLKTGLKAGQNNTVNLTVNIAQNSGEDGTATAG